MTKDLIAVLINEAEVLRGDVVPAPMSRGDVAERRVRFTVCYWAEKDQTCNITRDELIEVLEANQLQREQGEFSQTPYKVKQIAELIELLKGMEDG